MELWIRSQDKERLILAQNLDIYDCTLEDDEEEHWWIEESGIDLGEYTSKERALEVLDEIEEHIQKQGQSYILTDEKGLPAGLRNYGNIYEMPKE